MPYRAALFDLDGTLLNTLDDIADSMNLALGAMGFPQHPLDKYRYFVGDGVEVLAKRVLPQDKLDDKTLLEAVRLMRENYGRRWADKTRPYDGIEELLAALSARGVRLGVLSNKPDDFTRIMIEKYFGRWKMDPVVGARPGVPKKPDPTAANAIVAQTAIAASEFLYIGDTSVDMKTAVAAGMYPVGCLWGFRTADELQESGARKLVAHPSEILALI